RASPVLPDIGTTSSGSPGGSVRATCVAVAATALSRPTRSSSWIGCSSPSCRPDSAVSASPGSGSGRPTSFASTVGAAPPTASSSRPFLDGGTLEGNPMPRSLLLTRFLDSQYAQGLELAAASDLLELVPIGAAPVQRYIARLGCRGLVRTDRGEIEESVGCVVGIHFPEDYLRRVQPLEIVRWIAPENVFHPNCALAPNGVPVVCVGKIPPGTPLV